MSLERPSFPPVRLREGYDIEGLGFAPVRLRPADEMSPVDDWFGQVAAGHRLQAALIIAVVLAVTVWIYASRF